MQEKQHGEAHELRVCVAALRGRGGGVATRRPPCGGWGDSPRSVQSEGSVASSGDDFIVSDSAALTQDATQSSAGAGMARKRGCGGRLRRSGGAFVTNRALDLGERMGSKGYSSNSAGDGPGGNSDVSDAGGVSEGSENDGSENDRNYLAWSI